MSVKIETKFMGFFVILAVILLPPSAFARSDTNIVDDNLNQAAVFKEAMDYRNAINVLERLPDDLVDYKTAQYLGRLYYLVGEPAKALLTFEKIKEKGWYDRLYLGLIYEAQGLFPEAAESYCRSLGFKKTDIALYRLAKLYYKAEQYKQARAGFEDVVNFDPSIRLAYYYLGDCCFKLGDYKKAYYYFNKCMSFYPRNKIIKMKFALTKRMLGKDFFVLAKKEKDRKRKETSLAQYQPQTGSPQVSVGVALGIERFTFRCGGDFSISDHKNKPFYGKAGKIYSVILKDGHFLLYDYDRKIILAKLNAPGDIDGGSFAFSIFDVTYGGGAFWHKKIDRVFRGKLKAVIQSSGITLINRLSMEEYLYGVLPSEISADYGYEAIKAQAVAARTIAVRNVGRHKEDGFDFCSDVHCQAYQGMSAENELTTKAVDATRGEILTFKDKPIEAFYHANCGGVLRADAFGDSDYLNTKTDSVNDLLPESSYRQETWFFDGPKTFCSKTHNSKFRWQRVYDNEDFLLVFGYNMKSIEKLLPLEKSRSLRYDVVRMNISGSSQAIRGDLKIRNFFDDLRSGAFIIDLKYSETGIPEMLFFWGGGFGHGAGLCQEGAREMAQEGFDYKSILKHYYPGAQLRREYR